MRTSAWRLAGILLLLASPWAAAKVNNTPIPGWHGLGYEDGLLVAGMRSNPAVDSDFRSDMQRLQGLPDGPQKKAEEAKFLVKWQKKISDFSTGYTPGQSAPGTKISVAEARAQVPWLAAIDQEGWHGELFDQLHDRLSPPELAFIVARMHSLNDRPNDETRVGLVSALKENEHNLLAGAYLVASRMIGDANGDPKKTIRGYLSQLQREAAARTPIVIASAQKQLEELQAHPDEVASIMEGAKTNPAAVEAPAVQAPATLDSSKRPLPPAEHVQGPLQPAPKAEPKTAGADWLAGVPPPPPDTGAGAGEPTKIDLSPTTREVATSPAVLLGMAGGALAGAGVGLLLGGPIGALIGAAVGLIIGAVGGFGFLVK